MSAVWGWIDAHPTIVLAASVFPALLLACALLGIRAGINDRRTYDNEIEEYRRNERGSASLAEVLVPVALLVVGLIWAVVTRA